MSWAFDAAILAFAVMVFLGIYSVSTSSSAGPTCPETCKKKGGVCPDYCKKLPTYKKPPAPKSKPNIINKIINAGKKEFDLNAKYRVAPNGPKDQLCGGSKQGGAKDKKTCCNIQMYGDGQSLWKGCKNELSDPINCMEDRGCAVTDTTITTSRMDAINKYCNTHGGGQNEKCYTDRGVSVCKNDKDTVCWPNSVPCINFGTYDSKWGNCGTNEQGGSKCKEACCDAQHAFCKTKPTLDEYFSCMNDRGCMDKAKAIVNPKNGQCNNMKKNFSVKRNGTDQNFFCGGDHQGGTACKTQCNNTQYDYCKVQCTALGAFDSDSTCYTKCLNERHIPIKYCIREPKGKKTVDAYGSTPKNEKACWSGCAGSCKTINKFLAPHPIQGCKKGNNSYAYYQCDV